MCPQVCNPWLLSRTSPPLLSEDGTARLDTVVGGWRAGVSAGGRLGGPAHECNPRYRLSAGSLTQSANCELVDVVITFYQPDQRGVGGGNGGWADRYLYLHNSDSNAVEQEGVTTGQILKLWRRQQFVTVTLLAGQQYVLTPTAWAAGVEGRFWITCSAPHCELQPITAPTCSAPTPKQTSTMARVTAVVNQCLQCGEDFATERSYYDVGSGQVHSSCHDVYCRAVADKCAVCTKPILGSFYPLDGGGKACAEGDCFASLREAEVRNPPHRSAPVPVALKVVVCVAMPAHSPGRQVSHVRASDPGRLLFGVA